MTVLGPPAFSDSFGRPDTPVAWSNVPSWAADKPANVLDGSTAYWWQPIPTIGGYSTPISGSMQAYPALYIDRKSTDPITSVTVVFYGVGFQSTDYTVETSADNVTWTVRDTIVGNVAATVVSSFAATPDRYIKIRTTAYPDPGSDGYAHTAIKEVTWTGNPPRPQIGATDSAWGGTPTPWVVYGGQAWGVAPEGYAREETENGDGFCVIEASITDCAVQGRIRTRGTPAGPWQTDPVGEWVTWNRGTDGYVLCGWGLPSTNTDVVSLPAGVTLTVDVATRYDWDVNPLPAYSALQDPPALPAFGHKATTWYDNTEIQAHIDFTDAYVGQVSLYVYDWDQVPGASRRETITVDDGNGPQSVSLTEDFNRGRWVSFPIDVEAGGTLTIAVTNDNGFGNAVLEGIFLDQPDVGIVWRYSDINNLFVCNNNHAFKRVAGVFSTVGTAFDVSDLGRAYRDGDVVRVIANGNAHEVYVQPDGAGPFILVTSFTDSFNNTATVHGLRSSLSPTFGGIDSFRVSPLLDAALGTLTATLYDSEYSFIDTLEVVNDSAEWEEQLSDPGSGTVKIQAYAPDGTPLLRPDGDQFITFSVDDGLGGSVNAWTMRVDDDTKVRVARTLGERIITVGGKGPLALYEDSQVYPTMGYGAFPIQVDMYYDWRHFDYDDTTGIWVAPTSIILMSDAKLAGAPDWGHSAFLVWNDAFPAGPSPYPDPDIIWASSGSLTDAPVGKCYFRQHIDFPFELTYVMWLAADNRAIAYIDGVEIGGTSGTGTSPDTAGWVDAQTPIWFKCSAGEHVLAVEAENTPRSDSVPGNPAGVAWNIFIPGYPITLAMCIAHSNTSDVIMVEYPTEAPGMTPGNAVRLYVEKAQEFGDLPLVDISSFSDATDTNGEDWPEPWPCISTKVLTDGLTFGREVSGTYTDWRADRDNPFALQLYIKGTMNNTAASVDFRPDVDLDVVGMEIRRDYRIANVLIGVTKFGYVEVSDIASVSARGRHPRRVELGSYDNPDEVVRVLTEMLARYATTRDEIAVTIDGPLGYVHYDIGNTVPTVDSDDADITERIQAISARQGANGRLLTTPTVKDLFFYGSE